MKRVSKNLAKAITLSVIFMLPYGMAWADNVYTEAVTGSGDEYSEQIKKYDEKTNTYIYSFGEGAKLEITTSENTNNIPIMSKDENIIIDKALGIKLEQGLGDALLPSYAMLGNGKDLIIDRRVGGDIEITNGKTAVAIQGSNNKIYLGNGDITLNNTKEAATWYQAIDISSSGAYIPGENNLIVYGTGKIYSDIQFSSNNNKQFMIYGANINVGANKNGNKIILGYQGKYTDDDLNKFNDTNTLVEAVKNLGNVEINLIEKINSIGGTTVQGIAMSVEDSPSTIENAANNIIAAGDVVLKTKAVSNNSDANGIVNFNYFGNLTNIIAVKSVDIKSEAESINSDNEFVSANGIIASVSDDQTNSNVLVEVIEKSKIVTEVRDEYDGAIITRGIMAKGTVSYDSNNVKISNAVVNTGAMDITTTTNGGTNVENVGIKSQGGEVNVNGNLTVKAITNNAAADNKVYGLWSTNGGNINVNGTTNISTSGGQDIAVVAGTEKWTDVTADPDDGTNNINLNYGLGSKITGDIISGYGGHIVIGTPESTEEGISTFSARNNNGTLTLNGDALSANGGKLDINLTAGSTWTGRADDYQDAALPNWKDKHKTQFNPKFSHSIEASGDVNVTLAEGATWNVTGQSWLTKLDGTGGVIDMRNTNGDASRTSHAVHIGDLTGSHTFVMDLDTNHTVSDMLYIKGEASGEQKLWINSIEGLEKLEEDGEIRFATVNSANITFSGNYNFGSYENAKNGILLADNGVLDNAFVIKKENYTTTDVDNAGYNGTDFNETKPGEGYINDNYGEGSFNWLLAKDSSGDKVSDAGKTIINMSRANYKNAIYMDRLNKRMGEMRYVNGEEEQGLWVRLRHDRIGQSGDFRSMNTMYEVGYDVKQPTDNGEHRIGMAIDYMRGSTTYDDIMGKGETKRYGLWLYDTWLGEKGHYVDYVAKWGHLSNDFDITAKTTGEKINGDYSNNVFSVSAEYGKKNDMGNNWYFEPQAQLQLARVTGADYVTTQGSKVNVDGINSLIGRAGFRIGRDMDENSTVYLKADLLHEFMGDQTVTAADATGTLREEFENKGTWYDVGFGFAAKMSKNSYAFMDFEKSFGNDNDETYQINAGMQWSF